MSPITCTCPAGPALPDIPNADCPETFAQIQKVAIQRIRKDDGSKNFFPADSPITQRASWNAYLTADDSTKIIITPYIMAPATDGGDQRTFGSGNDVLGGVPIPLGSNPVTFSAVFRRTAQAVIKALKQLQCENLGVYLFDENGQIGSIKDSAGNHYPIPIRNFFVGDKQLGGFEGVDNNNLNWSFLANWSDNLEISIPEDFNPLSDLVIAATYVFTVANADKTINLAATADSISKKVNSTRNGAFAPYEIAGAGDWLTVTSDTSGNIVYTATANGGGARNKTVTLIQAGSKQQIQITVNQAAKA